jgi:ribosomal protein S18 acetylase RimI-like enzyme
MRVNLDNIQNRDSLFPSCFDCFPDSNRITKIFIITLAGAAVGACVGALLGSIVVGAVLGGAVGFLFGLYFCEAEIEAETEEFEEVIWNFPATELREKITESRVLEAIDKTEQVFSKALKFDAAYDNHALHNELTIITEAVRKQYSELQRIWSAFLRQKRVALFPDGRKVQLDFSLEQKRLDGKVVELYAERLTRFTDRDVEDIGGILRESFSGGELADGDLLKPQYLTEWIKKEPCLVVRDREGGRIMGLLRYNKKERLGKTTWHISCVGRKAGAARLGIGDLLFKTLKDITGSDSCSLHVRQKNVEAQRLYRKYGFQQVELKENYYRNENAYVYLAEPLVIPV